jgi:DoxX-like protein
MNQTTKFWMTALRWTLGIVVLIQSCLFVFASSGRHAAGEIGMPQWIRPVLGGSEIVATLLFLLPSTTVAGGYLLLVVFFFAAAIHVLHGQYDVGGLAVYAVAVMACISRRGEEVTPGSA